jgi:hypothetical protein
MYSLGPSSCHPRYVTPSKISHGGRVPGEQASRDGEQGFFLDSNIAAKLAGAPGTNNSAIRHLHVTLTFRSNRSPVTARLPFLHELAKASNTLRRLTASSSKLQRLTVRVVEDEDSAPWWHTARGSELRTEVDSAAKLLAGGSSCQERAKGTTPKDSGDNTRRKGWLAGM